MSDRYRDDRRRPRDEFEGSGSSQQRNVYPRGGSQQSPQDRWQQPQQGGSHQSGGHDGGRGGGGGGGGRGGFQGGRGGGPGGAGGRGPKKPHMGEIQDIIQLVKNSRSCSDAVMMDVVMEPDQTRDDLVVKSGDLFLPGLTGWREKTLGGLSLNMDAHQVFANHYFIDPAALPKEVYLYNVAIFGNKGEELRPDDLAKEGKEQRANMVLVKQLLAQNKRTWLQEGSVGASYDGGATLITTAHLPLGPENRVAERVVHPEDVKSAFSVALLFVKTLSVPEALRNTTTGEAVLPGSQWTATYKPTVQALDVALLAFARWQSGDSNPQWLLSGNKVFKAGGTEFPLNDAFKAMLGYYASLKVCKSGLLLVSDISVTCFLNGGPLINVMAALGGYRSVQDMEREARDQERANSDSGLDQTRLRRIQDMLKGCRVKLIHLGRNKKFKTFGGAANQTRFVVNEDTGEKVTVAEYYSRQVHEGDPRYGKLLSRFNGLQYPSFPTINIGSKNKPTLIPIELVNIPRGQTRQKAVDRDIASKIIKHAAMLPNDRMQHLSALDGSSLMGTIKADPSCKAFGLNSVDHQPARLHSTILTPVKLQYANRLIEPMLTGTWNLAGNVAFAHPAPGKQTQGYPYEVVLVHNGREQKSAEGPVLDFARKLEAESKIVGIPLVRMSDGINVVSSSRQDLIAVFDRCKYNGANIVLVVMLQEVYAPVKFAADTVNMVTQCIKYSTIERAPRGVQTNVLQKINLKMGGVNQTLASRTQTPTNKAVFQSPPQSISWMFNEPCMVVGVDVSHPEQGAKGPSVAAVVASMDGMLGQYACYVSVCESGVEPVGTLETAMHHLLKAFAMRNQGQYPRRVIIYRDGVADNQFSEILDKEISAFKNAVMLCGLVEESLKMSIVVCQKKHHTRLVYQQNGRGEYMNPCVGLCVDSTEGVSNTGAPLHSISSPVINEFYLNSHLAVLGTSKPAKYSLIYDEVGFKNAELQLLTYWTTHLYGRCTRGVSYATPAYYAHWAARRGKVLLVGGASSSELIKCTEQWLDPANPNSHSTMYFI